MSNKCFLIITIYYALNAKFFKAMGNVLSSSIPTPAHFRPRVTFTAQKKHITERSYNFRSSIRCFPGDRHSSRGRYRHFFGGRGEGCVIDSRHFLADSRGDIFRNANYVRPGNAFRCIYDL